MKKDKSQYTINNLDKCLDESSKNIEQNINVPVTNRKRIVLNGEGISPGIVQGRAFVYTDILTRNLQIYSINKKNIGSEIHRIHSAMDQVFDDLNEQKHDVKDRLSDQNHANIFQAHQEILKDKQLSLDLAEGLESDLVNAEIVVRNVFRKLSNKLRQSNDSVFSSKADDLDDISRRILRVLIGYESNILELLPSDSIIIAKRLLPSDTVHLKRESLKGIVVEEGSHHSHSALLARAFGITAIANIKEGMSQIHNGDDLILDGKNGIVIVNPTKDDKSEYEKRLKVLESRISALSVKAKEPAVTKCGQTVKLYANAYSEDDFRIAYQNGCDGIGLFRMEQLYMSCKSLPNEEIIFRQLKETFSRVPGKEITIRLLDIGGDKGLPYLNIKNERNPFLGVRGIRFLLKNPDILRTQINAIWRLSELYPVRLLIPMVTVLDEIRAVEDMLSECKEELSKTNGRKLSDLSLGIMIETPAAVFKAQQLSEHVDFFSIGTNDLLQYVMAAGRENVEVTDYYEKGEEIIEEIIGDLVVKGKKENIEVNV
ncbi:MAG TPA: phosphoenolpyruvate--protein phosphotransferase, partial [Bacteroidetes bacterium]|nr:phosphoenolpyruvate--protein phosphotransferase [Bacteroidota bacterium]